MTISTSGVPPRLKSTSEAPEPWIRPDSPTWVSFAASSSRWARWMRTSPSRPRPRKREVVLADLVALRAGRDRSSSCGGRSSAARPRTRARRRSSARSGPPARWSIGSVPGWPRQTGQVWTFGSSPKESSQPQNIFVFVESWTWISSPITGSQSVAVTSPPPVHRRRRPACRSRSPAPARRRRRASRLAEGGRRRSGSRRAARGPPPSRLGQPGRDRDRRDPGQRHRHRAVVGQVHRQRVVGARAELEGDGRRGRRDDEVEALEGAW